MVLHWKNNVSIDSANLLKQIPAFRYLKEPVNSASELYSKYPEGAEQGAFVLVMNQNMFYMYNAKRRVWVEILEGISTENIDNIIATAIEDKLAEYDLPTEATEIIDDHLAAYDLPAKAATAIDDQLTEYDLPAKATEIIDDHLAAYDLPAKAATAIDDQLTEYDLPAKATEIIDDHLAAYDLPAKAATAIDDQLTEYDLPAKATEIINDQLTEAVEDKLAEMGVEASITVSAYNALTPEEQQERNYVVVPG